MFFTFLLFNDREIFEYYPKDLMKAYYILKFKDKIYKRNDDEINQLIESMNIEINIPNDFIEVDKVIQGESIIYYDKGYKHKKLGLELRFFIIPISDFDKNPEQFYRTFPKKIFYNISHDTHYLSYDDYIFEIPKDDVINNFGGDLGYACVIKGKSDFLSEYQGAHIIVVYKENIGMFMLFQLYENDKIMDTHKEFIWGPAMQLLKYNTIEK